MFFSRFDSNFLKHLVDILVRCYFAEDTMDQGITIEQRDEEREDETWKVADWRGCRIKDGGCRTEDGKQRSEDVEGGGGRSMGVINTTSTPTSHGSNKDGPGRTKDRISGKDSLQWPFSA